MRRLLARGTVWVCAASLLVLLLPGAQGGIDVKVNADLPGDVQNEIRMTRNPTDLQNFVVAYNDRVGTVPSPLGVSYTLDGGLSWTDVQLGTPIHPVLGINLDHIFDPFVDSDSQGNIYAGYIANDGSYPGASGIFIERSTDKGQTWSGPTTIDSNLPASPPGGPDPSYRFNDRCDMAVDANDNVYIVWIKDVNVGQPTSDIYFAKSGPPGLPSPVNPTGLDFSGLSPMSVAPQTINDNPGGSAPITDFANVPICDVALDGTVYCAWIDVDVTNPNPKPGRLLIDRSTDGGVNFGRDGLIQTIDGMATPHSSLANFLSTASGAGTGDDARAGSYPVLAVDPVNSQTLYVAYAGDPQDPFRLDDGEILFTRSTDGGSTWSAQVRVNDDATSTDQFHPDMAVKPDGTIDIVWYDKRNGANDDMWDVYITKSTDGGISFATNVRITDQSFATPTDLSGFVPWMGEYLGLVVDGSTAYVAFTSSLTDSRGDVFFDSISNSAIGPPALCPRSQGYWKTHPGAWPVSSLTLGSESYSQVELLSLLFRPSRGDASLILAKQLIAAELSLANGSDPAPASGPLASAHTLLAAQVGKLPYRVAARSAAGQSMLAEASDLDDYNNRMLTPGCTPWPARKSSKAAMGARRHAPDPGSGWGERRCRPQKGQTGGATR